MSNQTECPGSYGQVNADLDKFSRLPGAGAWGVATCPVCNCRVPVMRPVKRRPVLERGRHHISAVRQERLRLNDLTRQLTGWGSFEDLLTAKGGYRPTLRADLDPANVALADAYDAAQAKRGDTRRAYRG